MKNTFDMNIIELLVYALEVNNELQASAIEYFEKPNLKTKSNLEMSVVTAGDFEDDFSEKIESLTKLLKEIKEGFGLQSLSDESIELIENNPAVKRLYFDNATNLNSKILRAMRLIDETAFSKRRFGIK